MFICFLQLYIKYGELVCQKVHDFTFWQTALSTKIKQENV